MHGSQQSDRRASFLPGLDGLPVGMHILQTACSMLSADADQLLRSVSKWPGSTIFEVVYQLYPLTYRDFDDPYSWVWSLALYLMQNFFACFIGTYLFELLVCSLPQISTADYTTTLILGYKLISIPLQCCVTIFLYFNIFKWSCLPAIYYNACSASYHYMVSCVFSFTHVCFLYSVL